ncbi:GNAT family N-acetyltransferase [Saccharibacillus sp. CPCC 101409]|uniref:GNAT family N-acetyltransferase n=1 Tax=Saccharibacillus sp. CPCC 101409 TaxID=3058041 RepID=UPI0026724164|nr:GNAT family N-acetyltransferase [Saccharibacillus sp. CPCC 101409]MDO3413401.1 GNAT family N-acetyltransferase [Saccharibacillus sp. CPCC 101409]
MSELKLVKPQMELKDEYLSFYQEWIESGEDMVPWVISKDPSDFQSMLKSLSDNEQGYGLPEGWVPDSTYWLVNQDNKVLGAVNIRHRLTEYLNNAGGHIGYGICPTQRKKGYATILLELALKEARKLGISEVLVVCDAVNIASEKTIIKNGGTPDADFIEDDGNVIKRYWIKN